MVIKKISKQELKEKTEAVKKILNIKGDTYENWLLEKQNEFINNNVSFLIEMASKNEPQEKEDTDENIEDIEETKETKETKDIKNNNVLEGDKKWNN